MGGCVGYHFLTLGAHDRMQQQIEVHQSPSRLLDEAATFFTKRRAKVTARTEQGFHFGLEGSDEREGGRITVSSRSTSSTTVTVEADGLGVMAMAESFVRDLRKQTRDAGRQGRNVGVGAARGGFGDLRERLGMPQEAARPATARASQPEELVLAPLGSPAVEPPEQLSHAEDAAMPAMTPPAMTPNVGAAAAPPVPAAPPDEWPLSHQASGVDRAMEATEAIERRPLVERPDGPTPVEAPAVAPEVGPHSPPAGDAAVVAAHAAFVGPDVTPEASALTSAHDSVPPPVADALATTPPSAESLGGVPDPGQVSVRGQPRP